MKIKDIRNNRITPFECKDEKLISLFSFFLHNAPTISSATAMHIDADRLQNNWNNYIETAKVQNYKFLSPNCKIEKHLTENQLHDEAEVNRRSKRFVCKYKDKNETDYECILRHLRNSIAHSHVYLVHAGNRKYVMFEDFNTSGNQSSLILLSQSDLKKLKCEIVH